MKTEKCGRILFWKVLAVLAVPAFLGFRGLDGQEGPWKLIFPPSARTDAGMVYDAAQDRMVLFGGFADGRACQDTWLFKEGVWTRFASAPSAPAPSVRGRFASCYNKTRGEMMVFGGTELSGLFGDLWTFKTSWKKSTAAGGPSAREGVAMAFNTHTGDIVLFGGKSAAGLMNDTWKYANGVWTKLTVAKAPPARWRHALVYDQVRRAFILYGGRAAGYLNDTWSLKGNTWTRIAGSSPGARGTHGMVYDEKGRRCLLFGGANAAGILGDTWAFKGGTWTRIVVPGPSARAGAAMAYDSAKNRVLLYGGWRGTNLLQADTWAFKNNEWISVGQSIPEARCHHGLAYDASRGRLVLFGGTSGASSSGRTFYADTWEREAGVWVNIVEWGPLARWDPSMVYDPSAKVVLLHGGRDSNWKGLKDTWIYEDGDWTKAAEDGPETSGAIAYYPKLGAVVLVDRYYRTYKWQSGAWTQIAASIQPYDSMEELSGTAMVYDARRNVLVLFGGEGTQYSRDWPPIYDTVWEFDGTSWTSHKKPSAAAAIAWPRERKYHILLYDPVRKRVVLSQGTTICRDPNDDNEYYNYRYLLLNDTWSWDGTNWTLLTQAGPAREGAAGVYDSVGGAWTAFGGRDFGAALSIYHTSSLRDFNDLFALKPPLPAAGTFDLGISTLSLSQLVWESEDQVTASVGVKNDGASASRPTSVLLYASLDDVIGADDILISQAVLASIPAGGSLPVSLNITVNQLQAAVPENLYNYQGKLYFYIGAVVDRFEQARDAFLGDNILFTDKYKCVTLKKPGSAAARRRQGN